jgi:hypothetical protein
MRGVDVGDRDDLVNYATDGLRLKIAARFGGVTLGGSNSWRVTPSHTQICL